MNIVSSIDTYLDAQAWLVDALGGSWDKANRLGRKHPEVNEILTHLRKLQYRLLQKAESLRVREEELATRERAIHRIALPRFTAEPLHELASHEDMSVEPGPLHGPGPEAIPGRCDDKTHSDVLGEEFLPETPFQQRSSSTRPAATHLNRTGESERPSSSRVETTQNGTIVASSWDGLVDLSLLEDDSFVCLSGEVGKSPKSTCDALGFQTADHDLTDDDRTLLADVLTSELDIFFDSNTQPRSMGGRLASDGAVSPTVSRAAESTTPVKRKPTKSTLSTHSTKRSRSLSSLDGGNEDDATSAHISTPTLNAAILPLCGGPPVDPYGKTECIRRVEVSLPALQGVEGFIDCQDRSMPKPSMFSNAKTLKAAHATVCLAEGWEFHVLRCLGRGAYGKAFKVKFSSTAAAETRVGVIKLQSLKSGVWEYYIRHVLASRSVDLEEPGSQCTESEGDRTFVDRDDLFSKVFGNESDISKYLSTIEHPPSILPFERFFAYKDDSVILMPFGGKHHLQDVANAYHARARRMPEVLVCHYTLQLLEGMATLHRADIVHGDVKPDNFTVLHEGSLPRIILIDFGNCLDLRMYPRTLFTGDHQVEGFRSPQAISGAPYRFQADFAGVCGIVHFLLHGQIMMLMQDRYTERWTPATCAKRYHRFVWDRFFDDLLNRTDEVHDSGMHRTELRRFLDGNMDDLVKAAEEQRRLLAGS